MIGSRMVRGIAVALALLISMLVTPLQGSARDEPVRPADIVLDQGGNPGYSSYWDDENYPGVKCRLNPIPAQEYVEVTPVLVYASPGYSSQRVVLTVTVWTENGSGDFVPYNAVTVEGITPIATGLNLPASADWFQISAGFERTILVTLDISWRDDAGEEVGYKFTQLEWYDNEPLGGGRENACYFSDYAPTPTPPSGGLQPTDLVRTTASVNIRSGPGLDYTILGIAPTNTQGQIIGFPAFADNRYWYPVQLVGFPAGFVAGNYLAKLPATVTPTRTPTATPTRTATRTTTPTRTATLSPTPSSTPSASNTPTITNTPTATYTPTQTNTPTDTATASNTPTASNTATATATPSSTNTQTQTLTPSNTATRTNTPVATNTRTPSPTRTPTRTPTLIPGGFAPGTLVRTTNSVNLRSGPGTNFSVLGTVPVTARGAVTGYPVIAGGYTWYPVSMNGYPAGYIAGQYLTTSGVATATRTRTPVPPTSTRTATPIVSITPGTSTPTRTATRTATTGAATNTPTRTPTTIQGGFAPGDQVRTNTGANLRSGPGTTFGVIDVVAANTNGTVLGYAGQANGYTWYQVSMNGYPVGYLASTLLTKTGSGPTVTPSRTRTPVAATTTPSATTAPIQFQIDEEIQVNTGTLNLRSGPGTGFPSLGGMPRGTLGIVTGAPQQVGSAQWYPVDMEGYGEGWVAGQYLTNVITAALEPPLEPTTVVAPSEVPLPLTTAPVDTPVPTLEPTLEPPPAEPSISGESEALEAAPTP